ncbi:MAG: PaaI family thioesterase [Celeribacter sp.]
MTDLPPPNDPKAASPDAARADRRQDAVAHQFIKALPFAHELGMRIDALDDGRAVVSMPYDQRLVGDPATAVIHGGAVSALIDTTAGAAVMCHPGVATTATLDLRIDYMRPATPGQRITAEAECYHATRNVAFVRARAVDEDTQVPVATAAGTFTVTRGTMGQKDGS